MNIISVVASLMIGVVFSIFTGNSLVAQQNSLNVWIGTSADGIYRFQLDVEKGAMTQPAQVSTVAGSGFVALHPSERVLYATGSDGTNGYAVSYSIGEGLTELSRVNTGDGRPSHISCDKSGSLVFTAQYGGGSMSMFRLKPDGSLDSLLQNIEHTEGSKVHGDRQNEPHPHWVGTGPNDKFVYVPDLGKDAVVVYSIERGDEPGKTKLQEVCQCKLGSGSGPRHMKFHQNGIHAYVICELTLELAAMSLDSETGKLTHIEDYTCLPVEERDDLSNSGAEVRIHPNGQFVYASNRGHDSITVFAIDEKTNKLSFVEREAIRGAEPRNFALDPSGKWLLAAGQNSNTVSLFAVDPDSGKLTFTRKVVNLPKPICVTIQP